MKVFVATAAGMEEDDYSRTVEGELVRLPVTCDADECDCGHAMTGMGSGAATTTFIVRDFEIEREMYAELMWGTMLRDGWVREGNGDDREWVQKLVGLHLDLAETFTPGVPLRLNGDRLYERH